MKKENCICCCEGIEALEERLERNDYTQLENLSLCNSCRGVLLVSIEDEAIKSERERDEQKD